MARESVDRRRYLHRDPAVPIGPGDAPLRHLTQRARLARRTTIAVISHNTREHLRACLTSVHGEGAGETLVVDNASTDGSVEMLHMEFPWVTLHACRDNPGFGAAANLAFRSCRTDYLLLLNADVLLRAGALATLAECLDARPSAGVVAPRLLSPDGVLEHSTHGRPSALNLFVEHTPLWRAFRAVPILREASPYTSDHSRPRSVHWAKGAALMIRRAAFEAIGGFDEQFFLYFEETDLCHRMRQAGWATHLQPDAIVVHVGEESARQRYADALVQRFASMKRFHRKHARGIARFAALRSVDVLIASRWIRDLCLVRVLSDPRRRADREQQLVAWRRLLGLRPRAEPRRQTVAPGPRRGDEV